MNFPSTGPPIRGQVSYEILISIFSFIFVDQNGSVVISSLSFFIRFATVLGDFIPSLFATFLYDPIFK